MKPIEKIGEVRYCFPAILLEGKNPEKVHILVLIDNLILKIDELVDRVNELEKPPRLVSDEAAKTS